TRNELLFGDVCSSFATTSTSPDGAPGLSHEYRSVVASSARPLVAPEGRLLPRTIPAPPANRSVQSWGDWLTVYSVKSVKNCATSPPARQALVERDVQITDAERDIIARPRSLRHSERAIGQQIAIGRCVPDAEVRHRTPRSRGDRELDGDGVGQRAVHRLAPRRLVVGDLHAAVVVAAHLSARAVIGRVRRVQRHVVV